jgi:S1-C subfamily serine protease
VCDWEQIGWCKQFVEFRESMSPIELTIAATMAVAIVAGIAVGALAPRRSLMAAAGAAGATFLAVWLVVGVASQISDRASMRGSVVLWPIDQYPPHAQQPPVTIPPPTSAQADNYGETASAPLTMDKESTVKVVSSACDIVASGSGFTIAPGLVLTNAHVVAGDPNPIVENGPSRYPAKPVVFDPGLDIAILRVPSLTTPALQLVAGTAGPRTRATVLGYPYGGPLTASPATILSRKDASGVDIYGKSPTTREIYEVQGAVRPGNSGGPLVGDDGNVLGVVFAFSTDEPDLGFALTSSGVRNLVQLGESAVHPVSESLCAAEGPGVIEVNGG